LWSVRVLCSSILIAVLLALVPARGPAQPRVHRIPFRTVQSMILVEGKVDGTESTFLLDTGAMGTIVSTRIYRSHYPLRQIHRNGDGPGLSGESISVRMNLEFGSHRCYAQRIAVMNLDELSRIIGIKHIDGLLGEDVLREFRSVRIDYKAHVIELEE
jgi:hypothetical protein